MQFYITSRSGNINIQYYTIKYTLFDYSPLEVRIPPLDQLLLGHTVFPSVANRSNNLRFASVSGVNQITRKSPVLGQVVTLVKIWEKPRFS
jgi:hypothetical protein